MPDWNMTPAIICLILSSYITSGHALISSPDFDSGWLTIEAADRSVNESLARKNISHGLGETPLLVDVQVKAIDGPNKDYIFQATGHQIRDDDYPEAFGNVVYVYDSKSVIVSAPVRNNHNPVGKPIFIANATFWIGPNQDYSSNSALFRVRAWKESSLPPADFVSKSNILTAATDNVSYLELLHGLGGYPFLVICRIRFPSNTTNYANFYADSVGAGIIVYATYSSQHAGYVVFGYDNENIRVWAPSLKSPSPGTLFDGTDGSGISVVVATASLEVFAWRSSTLSPDSDNLVYPFTNEISTAFFEVREDSLTRAWAYANNGANAYFIFPGSGSLAYSEQPVATPCSYGGLVYAYSNQSVRFWRPGSSHGSIICIQDVFGNGTNSQASSDVKLFMLSWITGCGSPTIMYGTATLDDPNNSTFGATAKVTCEFGYNTTKTSIICLSTGDWENANCVTKDCGPTPSISNGMITVFSGNTSYGASASVTCDPGYKTNQSSILCTNSGTWEMAACYMIDCGPPPTISNGTITVFSGNTTYGASASVTCDPGYKTNQSSILCTNSGTWETTACYIIGYQPSTRSFCV